MPSRHTSIEKNTNEPLDQTDSLLSMTHDIIEHHLVVCNCGKLDQCVHTYRRCIIDTKVYHSLIYTRRNSTISFFVQYYTNQGDSNFGKIRYFFTSNNDTFAVIDHHEIKKKFSNFISTSYCELLRKSIDSFFYVLYFESSVVHCVPIALIRNHCIIFEMNNCIIASPISGYGEHN